MSAPAAVIFILILLYTFYMGFNDGSNAIATTVATRAVKPRVAIAIAAATKFAVPLAVFGMGLLLGKSGFQIAGNIGSKLIQADSLAVVSPEKGFAFLLSGMLGAILWGGIAYVLKVPNSTSHTLLGGIIGAGIAAFGFSAVRWTDFVLLNVVLMVVLAPVTSMLLAYCAMKLTKKLARRAARGLNFIMIILQRINLVVLAGAFSNNNSQKAMGIFLLMGGVGLSGFGDAMPFWAVVSFAAALTMGLLFGGYRVINTVGRKIFKMQGVHSVVAQVSTSAVMLAATSLGVSVSTGQVMSSAIMGVGAAERARRVQWHTAIRIAVSWILTLPIAATVGGVAYLIIGKLILGIA